MCWLNKIFHSIKQGAEEFPSALFFFPCHSGALAIESRFLLIVGKFQGAVVGWEISFFIKIIKRRFFPKRKDGKMIDFSTKKGYNYHWSVGESPFYYRFTLKLKIIYWRDIRYV